jgi:hypothetical protein
MSKVTRQEVESIVEFVGHSDDHDYYGTRACALLLDKLADINGYSKGFSSVNKFIEWLSEGDFTREGSEVQNDYEELITSIDEQYEDIREEASKYIITQEDVDEALSAFIDEGSDTLSDTLELVKLKHQDKKGYANGFGSVESLGDWLLDTNYKLDGKKVNKDVIDDYDWSVSYIMDYFEEQLDYRRRGLVDR